MQETGNRLQIFDLIWYRKYLNTLDFNYVCIYSKYKKCQINVEMPLNFGFES